MMMIVILVILSTCMKGYYNKMNMKLTHQYQCPMIVYYTITIITTIMLYSPQVLHPHCYWVGLMSMLMSHNPIRPYVPRNPHEEQPYHRVCEKVVSPSRTQKQVLEQEHQTQPQSSPPPYRRHRFLLIMMIIIIMNVNLPRRYPHPPNQCQLIHRRPLLPRPTVVVVLQHHLYHLYLFHFNPKYKFICIVHPWKYGHPVDGPVGLVVDSMI